ncbi:MAG: hypothetical protein K1V78_09820 [Muribaculaceae bacterium]
MKKRLLIKCLAALVLLGGITSCGTIRTHGGIEHEYEYNFDGHHHHHKPKKHHKKHHKHKKHHHGHHHCD